MAILTPSNRKPVERALFPAMALFAAVIVFAGFARTYYLGPWFGAPALKPLVQLHGFLGTAWIAVFGLQVWLVESRRVSAHRRVGAAGALLALMMVVIGALTAIVAARHGHTPTDAIPPRVFLAIPLFNILTFALLVGTAVWLRGDRVAHKRLMLIATISILEPAFARLPFDFIRTGGPPVFFALTDALVVAGMFYDRSMLGVVPRVWFLGGGLLLVSQIVCLLVAPTSGWAAFAGWLIK